MRLLGEKTPGKKNTFLRFSLLAWKPGYLIRLHPLPWQSPYFCRQPRAPGPSGQRRRQGSGCHLLDG